MEEVSSSAVYNLCMPTCAYAIFSQGGGRQCPKAVSVLKVHTQILSGSKINSRSTLKALLLDVCTLIPLPSMFLYSYVCLKYVYDCQLFKFGHSLLPPLLFSASQLPPRHTAPPRKNLHLIRMCDRKTIESLILFCPRCKFYIFTLYHF